jgi:hypothetical protein
MGNKVEVRKLMQSVAVIADDANISSRNASAILSIATTHDDPIVARVYLDARRHSDWHGAIGNEPRRICRRLISVSYAAMASVSRAA